MIERIFAWVLGRLRWLCLGAMGLGIVLVYMGWTDSARIRDVQANGVEATAAVEGATRVKRRRGGESYSLKLVWRDAKGVVQTVENVSVSSGFAHRIIRNDKIVVGSVRIKYLPEATIDSKPLVLDDAAAQEGTDDFMQTAGMYLAGGGAVGALLLFLLPRRRRSAGAPQPQ